MEEDDLMLDDEIADESEDNEDVEDEEELLLRSLAEQQPTEWEEQEAKENEQKDGVMFAKWFISFNTLVKLVIIACIVFVCIPMLFKIFSEMNGFLESGNNQLGTFFK